MTIAESIRLSIEALISNKMRSLLTMLGVIIGVAAVIALISLGQGSQQAVTSQITTLGTNLINVSVQRSGQFTDRDMTSLLDRVPTLQSGSPIVTQPLTLKSQGATHDTTVTGVGESYVEIRNYTVGQGRFFDEADVAGRKKLAVLGETVYRELFQGRRAIGETVSIQGQPFTVIGVLAAKGSSMGQDSDDLVLIPYSSAQRLFGTAYITSMVFKADSSETASTAADHIKRILEERFRTASRGDTGSASSSARRPEPFRVFSQDELLKTVNQMTGTFTALLAGIASVSLLVGGIGIMNIMLVSVTERTREIGVRKALGARRWDILRQFIIESTVISGLGGVVGVGIGWLSSLGFGKLFSIPATVSPAAAGLAFGFAAAVGLFFGIYPAQKAASLDPIIALRYD